MRKKVLFVGFQMMSVCLLVWGQASTPAPIILDVGQAEALALKNNPAITVARLDALAQQQVARQVRSSLWPQAAANLTAVDIKDNSRITAGALNNPTVLDRAAGGVAVSQLITDFGHSTNQAASARLHAQAEEQYAIATREQVLIAVDQSFYRALQTQALVKVAQETVTTRQTVADQISALTKSKLKSDLDLSFANVNLAQAKLLLLDAENDQKAAQASLAAILGFQSVPSMTLVEDSSAAIAPLSDIDEAVRVALAKRPEVLGLDFDVQSAAKNRAAQKDLFFPTISAVGVVGGAPVRSDAITSWYGAIGVNMQIPVFNGFLFSSRAHEAELREQAQQSRLADLRNRIARDVRTSWLNANSSYEKLSVTKQLLDQANLALDLAQTRYSLGLSSIVELSQAQLQQTQAAISNTTAQYDYRFALAQLQFQMAGK